MELNLESVAATLSTIASHEKAEDRNSGVQRLFKALCARTSDRTPKLESAERAHSLDDQVEAEDDEADAGGKVEPRVYERIAEEIWNRGSKGTESLLPYFVELMNVDLFPGVMALLSYRCLANVPGRKSESLLNANTIAVVSLGSRQLFWIDIDLNRRWFAPVYSCMLDQVLFDEEAKENIGAKSLRKILQYAYDFYFFYQDTGKVETFLDRVAEKLQHVLRSQKLGDEHDVPLSEVQDEFVSRNVELAESIGNGIVLLRYIRNFKRFHRWSLTAWTSNKLQVFLNAMAYPSRTLDAPRLIQQESGLVMDILFPDDVAIRRVTSGFFAYLQPSAGWNLISGLTITFFRSVARGLDAMISMFTTSRVIAPLDTDHLQPN